MLDNTLLHPRDLIDQERYPIFEPDNSRRRDLVEQCRQALRERALCQLPGFVPSEIVARMAEEVSPLVASAPFREEKHSFDYHRRNTDTYPEDHPLRALHLNRYNQALNHQIANDSLIRRLYMSDELTAFVRDVFGAETFFRSQCPHLALSVKIEGEGDTDGWHYDSNDGVVSLLLQKPDSGGEFEYAPYVRGEDDERYDDVARVLENPKRHAIQPGADAGTFVFFNGKRSLHRVTPVAETKRPRIIALLCYDKTPNFVMPQSYIDYLNELPVGRPTP